MKITKTQLKQIIKEELEIGLNEGTFTDIMDIFFPTEHALEKRRKMDAMSDEEIASMIAKARAKEEADRAKEEADYEREAGILPQGEEIPGYGGVKAYQDEERTATAAAEELAAAEAAARERAANAASERERREAELEAEQLRMAAGEKRAADRKARGRERGAEMERNRLANIEKRKAAAAARGNLEEVILRKILEKLR